LDVAVLQSFTQGLAFGINHFPARRPQFGCRKQAIIAQGIIALDSRPLSAQTFLDLWEQFWRQAMAEAGMNHGWLHAPSPAGKSCFRSASRNEPNCHVSHVWP
jgi:hypothetical protein